MVEKMPKRMVGRKEAAMMFSVAAGTLANMLCEGRGPRAFRVGRRILYKIEDLEEFFCSSPVHTVDSLRQAE
jgi:hypothetical protein